MCNLAQTAINHITAETKGTQADLSEHHLIYWYMGEILYNTLMDMAPKIGGNLFKALIDVYEYHETEVPKSSSLASYGFATKGQYAFVNNNNLYVLVEHSTKWRIAKIVIWGLDDS